MRDISVMDKSAINRLKRQIRFVNETVAEIRKLPEVREVSLGLKAGDDGASILRANIHYESKVEL